MSKYEYKTIKSKNIIYAYDLNEYGSEGWELAAVASTFGFLYYYFKRIKE